MGGIMVNLSSEVSSHWSGDLRIGQRLNKVVTAIGKSPAKSFPKIFKSSDELEAFYRLLRNERATWGEIFISHVKRTLERVVEEEEEVLCTIRGIGNASDSKAWKEAWKEK